jgi:hypothetical protein
MNQKWSLGLALLVASGFASRVSSAHDIDPDSRADNYAKFWLTLEADRVGGQASTGTTLPLGPLELAVNAVFNQAYSGVIDPLQNAEFAAEVGDGYRSPSARLELGPAFDSGGFFLLPKVGLGYDFERKKVAPLVPQLISIIQGGPAYMETWLQVHLYDLFDEGSQDADRVHDRSAERLGQSHSQLARRAPRQLRPRRSLQPRRVRRLRNHEGG